MRRPIPRWVTNHAPFPSAARRRLGAMPTLHHHAHRRLQASTTSDTRGGSVSLEPGPQPSPPEHQRSTPSGTPDYSSDAARGCAGTPSRSGPTATAPTALLLRGCRLGSRRPQLGPRPRRHRCPGGRWLGRRALSAAGGKPQVKIRRRMGPQHATIQRWMASWVPPLLRQLPARILPEDDGGGAAAKTTSWAGCDSSGLWAVWACLARRTHTEPEGGSLVEFVR